ncbi:MAG: transposase [Anaerolineae bacterium]|nr:transposase [Anaerolineae bacterium]
MQCSIKRRIIQLAPVRLHVLVVLSLLVLAMVGRVPDSEGGWLTCPPQAVIGVPAHRGRGCKKGLDQGRDASYWLHLSHTWPILLVRSLLLWGLWHLSGQMGPAWVRMVPWVLGFWQGVGLLWPWLRCQPEWQGVNWLLWQGQRLLMVSYLGLGLGALLRFVGEAASRPSVREGVDVGQVPMVMGLGCLVCGREEPQVEVVCQEDGSYQATLCGHFTLRVAGDHPFRVRMLMLFLRLLEGPGPQRGGRRTRDGRTPFVRQEQLAAWFQMPQPDISRLEKYWLAGDWPNLLSLKTAEVLTPELVGRIVTVFVTFPWWRVEKVYHYLQEQGVAVSWRQVRQAAQQSGWSQLRQELRKRYHLTAEGIRPKDGWLVEQLLGQVQQLVERLEALGGLTDEQQIALADLEALGDEWHLRPAPARRALPWILRVERLLWGHWEGVEDETVRCIYCGATDVSRKSRQPRWKRYVDEKGQEQKVAVYRYYCHNPACQHKTFTNLPPHLMPYSKWTLDHRLAALQTYEWSRSVYRRTSQMLGVSKMTAYRWVSGFGYQLLPVAALFGMVRSSGVVGVDEKYVLVPKNDKPEGEMKRWMYVYFAVDCYTYDLLHIEIYPYNTQQSARAFLLALRAKGYRPRVVVTDMRVDYRGLVAQVFPKAVHHECLFHALQQVREHAKEAYGKNYPETHPEVEKLMEEIDRIFDACTKQTARRRYEKVLAQRETFVTQTPDAAALFDFLERHWPYLVNAIESRLIPTTNNATEEVIRIFTQHYKTFCGFENIDSARLYLGVFEKIYRFTPFSDDAQERIRGKCPLELAGYEVQKLPMAQLFRGLALQWPASAFQELVPNM